MDIKNRIRNRDGGLLDIFRHGFLLGAVCACSAAHAQLVQNISVGNPKAMALAHAVTADPPGIDSIHFNPAGLAKIDRRQWQVKLFGAYATFDTDIGASEVPFDIKQAYCGVKAGCDADDPASVLTHWPTDPVANTSYSTDKPALMLPGSGLTSLPALVAPFFGVAVKDYQHDFTFATAIYSPQAFGYERDEDSPARYQGIQASFTRITYLAPSIGFKASDTLSLGASAGLSWQGVGLRLQFRTPQTSFAFLHDLSNDLDTVGVDILNVFDICDTVGTMNIEMEDALAFSFNLGALWEPTPWLAFGMVYQSESKSRLSGDYRMENTPEFLAMTQSLRNLGSVFSILNDGTPLNAAAVEQGTVELDYILPKHFAVGTSVQVFPDLKLNVDLKWTDYAAWDSLDFEFSNPVDYLSLANVVYKTGVVIPEVLSDGDNADPDVMRAVRDYKSVWSWAMGAEYQYNDNLVLRAGYEPRKSAIPDNRVDLMMNISDADLYTAGFGYRLNKLATVDFALAYFHSGFDAPAGRSENLNTAQDGHVIYNPYQDLEVASDVNVYAATVAYTSVF